MLITSVATLAMIIGYDPSKIPYTAHKNIPILIHINIPSDISRVDFVLITFTVCGIYAAVVKNAAK